MSLRLMKERVKVSGITPREEMIRDGQNILKEELEHDSSYSPTMFFYDSENNVDDRFANLRVYGRKYSSLNGNYMNFLTTYDNHIKIGDYIHDTKDDTYWLVQNSFNVNDVHYEGKLIQCNYLLRWQLSNGKVVERWANIVSASKYDVGENGNQTIVLSTNNFTILIGFCEEGFELEGKRVFIDRNSNPRKVFKITRGDDVIFDSGNMGSLLSFIADKDQFNPSVDRADLKLCNYIDIFDEEDTYTPIIQPNEITLLSANIKGIKSLKIGSNRICTAIIIDSNGDELEWDNNLYGWNIVGDINLQFVSTDNRLKLFVDDESYIGSSFFVQIISILDDKVIGEIEIPILGIV